MTVYRMVWLPRLHWFHVIAVGVLFSSCDSHGSIGFVLRVPFDDVVFWFACGFLCWLGAMTG